MATKKIIEEELLTEEEALKAGLIELVPEETPRITTDFQRDDLNELRNVVNELYKAVNK